MLRNFFVHTINCKLFCPKSARTFRSFRKSGGGQGGWRPREEGAGGVREAGEEGAGGVREAGEEGAGGVREAGEEGRKVGFPR